MTDDCPLDDYGVLQIGGADARRFLQGQLSNDLQRLEPARPLRAGLHNPQGRVLALLRLWPASAGDTDVLALLPAELLSAVATQLRRYVLRARVTIEDASDRWRAWGLRRSDGSPEVRLAPRDAAPVPDGTPLGRDAWEALEIAAGLPEVRAATTGEFVAQMLNLDCIEAIAWDKGCYTGQEIIARAHYRGQMKRRMRRFAAALADPPAPGATHTTSDGVELRVVRAARVAAGRCELLGVAPLERPSHDELPLPYAWPAGRAAGGA